MMWETASKRRGTGTSTATAVGLMRQGHTNTEMAEMVGTTPQSVGRWRRACQKRGPAGLAAKPAPGRPPRLSPRQKQRLVARLLNGARANGFATDLWT